MPQPYKVEIATSIARIDAAEWDACANPDARSRAASDRATAVAAAPALFNAVEEAEARDDGERFNPFLTHAFLKALETSKSVSPAAGWSSAHVLVRDANGRLAAAAPTYLKSHSMGEYVFDFGWADAYQRAGLDYYPKLQVAAPFTPVTGRRLLLSPGHGEAARQALIAGLRACREAVGASSIHVTFPTKADWEALGSEGFLLRTGQQFHFINKGYATFDDFLNDLASRKRKMIRRERKEALAAGVEIECLTGSDIKDEHWDAFFLFYTDTGARKWGTPYLTRAFFESIGAAMADDILLVMAKRAGRYIAGAINFLGKDALYGRNWGAIEDHPFLHFEVCYYQAIAFAISRGLSRVEAGAQGEHKLARGYGPVATYSAHEIADPRFARAIDDYLKRERLQSEMTLADYAEQTPFKKAP
ncbi:GNAT family N-acetyltransferase [Methylocella tundrae]|uniref:GNAT family N-acetyltransferase n=1 Tax=Methylocella tundrae TaxID=227605 RepID=A0A4U8YV56_METTU|nr:GNAT family N-acetyltransferase [Methylocella tundrae]WPP04920.1 GNAT family N-acetyltransferase [Methylocella tundrae]VFU07192.1 GNAT family N-acetyltransferase [Methylocella tundrae]